MTQASFIYLVLYENYARREFFLQTHLFGISLTILWPYFINFKNDHKYSIYIVGRGKFTL